MFEGANQGLRSVTANRPDTTAAMPPTTPATIANVVPSTYVERSSTRRNVHDVGRSTNHAPAAAGKASTQRHPSASESRGTCATDRATTVATSNVARAGRTHPSPSTSAYVNRAAPGTAATTAIWPPRASASTTPAASAVAAPRVPGNAPAAAANVQGTSAAHHHGRRTAASATPAAPKPTAVQRLTDAPSSAGATRRPRTRAVGTRITHASRGTRDETMEIALTPTSTSTTPRSSPECSPMPATTSAAAHTAAGTTCPPGRPTSSAAATARPSNGATVDGPDAVPTATLAVTAPTAAATKTRVDVLATPTARMQVPTPAARARSSTARRPTVGCSPATSSTNHPAAPIADPTTNQR